MPSRTRCMPPRLTGAPSTVTVPPPSSTVSDISFPSLGQCRRILSLSRRRRREVDRQLGEQPGAEARAPGGLPACFSCRLGGSGDVDVRPWHLSDELGEEQGGGDRPGVGTAKIPQVGNR